MLGQSSSEALARRFDVVEPRSRHLARVQRHAVCGVARRADHDPLIALADQLGWRTTTWLPASSRENRMHSSAVVAGELDLERIRVLIEEAHSAMVVVMGHHPGRDRAALQMAPYAEHYGLEQLLSEDFQQDRMSGSVRA